MTPETTALSRRYADYLLAEGRSERTIENYLYALKGFGRFLGERRLVEATSNDIIGYQVHIAARGFSDSAVRVATYALRGFFLKILERQDWNMARLPRPSRPYRLPEVLSAEEVKAIIEAAPSPKYAAVFMLCYGAGLRTEEVIHLEPRHIDSARMVIRIERGKGDKDRLVLLPEKLLVSLRECWRRYRPKKYLIEGIRPGQPMAATSIQRAFHTACKNASIKKPVTPRSFRHAFATHLVESGARLQAVQALLGHQSLNTTTIYVRLAKNWLGEVKSPLDALDPRAARELIVSCGTRATPSVAEVLRDHVASLRLSPEQGKAAAHIIGCRTGRFGGHIAVCDRCGGKHYALNSCRDRHCPRCGGLDQAIWAEAQQQHLLPLAYYHLVFTIPFCLRPFFLGPGRVHAFEALFATSSETLLEVAARQGLSLGLLAVLHTWNQKLDNHPHIHCLVPGGGFGKDGFVVMSRFLYSYKRLRRLFKIKLLQKLRALLAEGVMSVGRASGHRLLKRANSGEWNVRARRSLAGPQAVIKYFARYTRRIAISNSRILAYDGKTVTYAYRDRQDGNRVKQNKLDGPAFCQRFLSHVLPPGFVRIRRYGTWSNRVRREWLAKAREALGAKAPPALVGSS